MTSRELSKLTIQEVRDRLEQWRQNRQGKGRGAIPKELWSAAISLARTNAIQETVLFLPKIVAGRDGITEKRLRDIAQVVDWEGQQAQFESWMARW